MHGRRDFCKRCIRRCTVVATSGRLQGLWAGDFTYGDSMLFLKCVTDKGGSERTKTFKFSISSVEHHEQKSDTWMDYKTMPPILRRSKTEMTQKNGVGGFYSTCLCL